MSLPKLNDVPKYIMTVPSSGKKIKYRPYLVREEKVLLLAAESKDVNQSIEAMTDTVLACVEDGIDPATLSTFDLEYMFLKIRSKSAGERIDVTIPCEHCEHRNVQTIDIEGIEIAMNELQTNVELTENISVDLKWPSYSDIEYVDDPNELGFEVLSACIEAVCTNEERILVKDESKEEVRLFLESLTADQFRKISQVVESIPKVSYPIEFDCEECNKHNDLVIEGVQSFF
jgi:hypothetical protein